MSSNYNDDDDDDDDINNNDNTNNNFQKSNNDDDKLKKKPSESNKTYEREQRLSRYYVDVLIDKSPDFLGSPLKSEKPPARPTLNLLSSRPSGNNVVNGSVVNASVVNGNVINGTVDNGNVVNSPDVKSSGDEEYSNVPRSAVAYGSGMMAGRGNSGRNDNYDDIDSDDGFGDGFENEMGQPTFEKYDYDNRSSSRKKKPRKSSYSSNHYDSAQNTSFDRKKSKRGGAVSKTIPIFDEEKCKADFKREIARKQQMKYYQTTELSRATNKVSNLAEELEVVTNQIDHNNKKLFEWTYGFLDVNFDNMSVRSKRQRKSQIIGILNNNIVNLSFQENRLKIDLKKARKRVKKIEKKIQEIESLLASDISSYNYNFM